MKKIFLTLFFAVLFLFCSCTVNQPQNDDGDIILGYMSFQNGDDLYYIEPTEKKSILKNSNNKITTLLSSDNIIADMLLHNGKIYYCEKYGIKLYAVDLNGENAELILDGESTENFYGSEFFSWCIYENNLYLNCNLALYKINLETHEWECFNDDVYSAYQFFDGHLYYIDHAERTFTIYKQNIETKKIEVFIGEGVSRPVNNIYSYFVISPDGTFYILKRAPSELISYKGGVAKVIDSGEKFEDGFSLMYYKEQLYYVKVIDGQYYLYRYDRNADSITEIGVLDNYKRAIFVDENYYYYSSEHITTKDSLLKIELD